MTLNWSRGYEETGFVAIIQGLLSRPTGRMDRGRECTRNPTCLAISFSVWMTEQTLGENEDTWRSGIVTLRLLCLANNPRSASQISACQGKAPDNPAQHHTTPHHDEHAE